MINSIKSELDNSSNIYLTDCSGLNADLTSKLRRACFKSNIKLSVVKNTLLEKAMTSSEKEFGELDQVLKGNTALMFSEIANATAKIIKEFRKIFVNHRKSSRIIKIIHVQFKRSIFF